MSEMWTAENQRIKRSLSILDKYQLALLAANAPKIDPGLTVYQSAKDVIDIRNALVHFSPETQFDHSQIALEKRLRGKNKFTENQQDVGSPWYPNKALGAGLAAWACESVTAVVAQWQGRLHTEYDYAQWIALNP